MNSFLLDEADFSRLHAIYYQESIPAPSPGQRREIGVLLASTDVSDDPEQLRKHVGFGDEVVLTSLSDVTDDFVLRIVTPRESDPANDRVSIFMPVSLAVFGRCEGDTVSWEANDVLRKMKIASVTKAEPSLEAVRVP